MSDGARPATAVFAQKNATSAVPLPHSLPQRALAALEAFKALDPRAREIAADLAREMLRDPVVELALAVASGAPFLDDKMVELCRLLALRKEVDESADEPVPGVVGKLRELNRDARKGAADG